MPVYTLSPIFKPQYVANAAAALVFAPSSAGGGSVVPANYAYQIAVLRVANKTNGAVTLEVWRVPAGAADDDPHIVVPTVSIPPASNTFPDFDVTALWGAVLLPGDAIWMIAGAASSLIVQGDGAVIT